MQPQVLPIVPIRCQDVGFRKAQIQMGAYMRKIITASAVVFPLILGTVAPVHTQQNPFGALLGGAGGAAVGAAVGRASRGASLPVLLWELFSDTSWPISLLSRRHSVSKL
jgi:hypothetical protein